MRLTTSETSIPCRQSLPQALQIARRKGRLNRAMSHLTINRLLLALAACALTAGSYAQWTNPADDIPAYHPSAPLNVRGLPPILSGSRLTAPPFQYTWQVHVYQDVAKVSSVVYQLPCNCRCDRELGHTSLRSCFEGLHGAECATCAQEGFYAYQQARLGKTPAQIRAGILRHEYASIDLAKE